MFKELYLKSIKLAGHKNSKFFLGFISFIESFIFPIPPDVVIIPMTIAKRQEWIKKGWIFKEDPLGWFQWYCRYTNGRRIQNIDEIQIQRWINFTRHVKAIKKNCEEGDLFCRRRQRQAILQWAYDPFI